MQPPTAIGAGHQAVAREFARRRRGEWAKGFCDSSTAAMAVSSSGQTLVAVVTLVLAVAGATDERADIVQHQRRIGEPGWLAKAMPKMPPIEVPTQSTVAAPLTAIRAARSV